MVGVHIFAVIERTFHSAVKNLEKGELWGGCGGSRPWGHLFSDWTGLEASVPGLCNERMATYSWICYIETQWKYVVLKICILGFRRERKRWRRGKGFRERGRQIRGSGRQECPGGAASWFWGYENAVILLYQFSLLNKAPRKSRTWVCLICTLTFAVVSYLWWFYKCSGHFKCVFSIPDLAHPFLHTWIYLTFHSMNSFHSNSPWFIHVFSIWNACISPLHCQVHYHQMYECCHCFDFLLKDPHFFVWHK